MEFRDLNSNEVYVVHQCESCGQGIEKSRKVVVDGQEIIIFNRPVGPVYVCKKCILGPIEELTIGGPFNSPNHKARCEFCGELYVREEVRFLRLKTAIAYLKTNSSKEVMPTEA